jgi:hypothetical protein
VVNAGAGVKFYPAGSKHAVLECDGFLKNASVVVLNEAKASPKKENVWELQLKVIKL